MQLIERDRSYVLISNPQNQIESYDIIANFPFSSATKKMSVLVKCEETGRIIYFVKGAEVVMEHKIKPQARASLLEFCE